MKVFHAGTAREDGRLVAVGGRVLDVTAIGDTVFEAARRAYEARRGGGLAEGLLALRHRPPGDPARGALTAAGPGRLVARLAAGPRAHYVEAC